MSDKDFKVKNKLVVNGLTGGAGPLVANSNKEIDSVAFLTTLQGGTGTTTSPSAGQVLYSASGTTYNPTTLNTLDVKGATYSADAPSSPVVGQIWVESDTSSDSFDPNIIRRKTFTATAAQTVFTTDLEFIQGYEQVFFNGMLLIRNSDYTTASNTNVTLAAGAAAGDIIEVVSITNLNSINAVATTGANTITSTTASTIPLTIQGAASQSAKLLDMKNNSGSSIAYFGPNGALSNTGVSLSSYGQVACQSTDTGISISGSTGYPNGGTIVFRGNNGGAGGTAANGLEFVAGGTEKMRITSEGNLYIGTTNASAYGGKLAIANGGQASMFMWNVGQGSGHIGFPASGSTMRIVNTYADGLIANGVGIDITTTGRIGIGTGSPAARLHIDNTGGNAAPLRIKPPSGGYNYIEAITASNGNIAWGINDGGTGDFRIYQYDINGSYARTPLLIDSTGVATFSTAIRTNLIYSGRNQTHTSGSGYLNIGGSGFVVIHGFIGGNEFWDVIIGQFYGSLNVISSAVIGSPPTRTYSMNQSGGLGLSMSGGTAGTYTINTHQMN